MTVLIITISCTSPSHRQVEWLFHFTADFWATVDRHANHVDIDRVASVSVVPVLTLKLSNVFQDTLVHVCICHVLTTDWLSVIPDSNSNIVCHQYHVSTTGSSIALFHGGANQSNGTSNIANKGCHSPLFTNEVSYFLFRYMKLLSRWRISAICIDGTTLTQVTRSEVGELSVPATGVRKFHRQAQ